MRRRPPSWLTLKFPWGVEALSGTISQAGLRTKPSWYLVVTDDKMIPPLAQRFMSSARGSTVVEVAGSPRDLCVAAKRPYSNV